ncbi:MAG: hypothetical protein ABR538_00475 [Candidatus Binatia bacterium]
MSTPPCQVLETFARVARRTRRRSATGRALAGLLAFTAAACFDTAAPPSEPSDPFGIAGVAAVPCVALPETTPALSVAGPHYPKCADSVRHACERSGAVGGPIARQVRCQRFTVVVAVPLPPTIATPESPEVALFRTTLLLRSLFLPEGEQALLRALADYLRLSPQEPFTFGTRVDVSEDGSMSLRLQPKGGGGRLMLMYKLDL